MSTEFVSEFSYSADREKEQTDMEDLIHFYERELKIDQDDEKEGDKSQEKINDCQEDFKSKYQQVLQRGLHASQADYLHGLVEAYENEMKDNEYFKEEKMKNDESLEEDLEWEYEKVLNQFYAKKEEKDELVKAYEMEMIEVEDVHVIEETKYFVESQLELEYFRALEKGFNGGGVN